MPDRMGSLGFALNAKLDNWGWLALFWEPPAWVGFKGNPQETNYTFGGPIPILRHTHLSADAQWTGGTGFGFDPWPKEPQNGDVSFNFLHHPMEVHRLHGHMGKPPVQHGTQETLPELFRHVCARALEVRTSST